jgi:transcriptional regulator with XRE-family HTH domain
VTAVRFYGLNRGVSYGYGKESVVIELTRRREERGLSKSQLSFASRVPASTIGQIEAQRFRPYNPQLRRLADALGWSGDPAALLEEVGGGQRD